MSDPKPEAPLPSVPFYPEADWIQRCNAALARIASRFPGGQEPTPVASEEWRFYGDVEPTVAAAIVVLDRASSDIYAALRRHIQSGQHC